MYFFNQTKQKGFTLIEVLVSLSIFTVIVTISVSVLYSLIDANARARNAQSIASNLAFTLDSLTREIRLGQDYMCTSFISHLPVDDTSTHQVANAPTGEICNYFSFNEGKQGLTADASSRRIAIRAFDGYLQRRLGDGDWENLTSEDVYIEDLRFYARGTSRTDDDLAPRVTMFVSALVGDEESTRTEFQLQTTITQSLLDI